MATANQNVTADKLISATVKYSNKDDASRAYDISANVNITNGKVQSFESGEVRKVQIGSETEPTPVPVTFNAYGAKNFNLYVSDADEEETKAIVEAIYAFMADVKANVNTNPVTA